ncbi:FAD:protein FMN transferase [Lachnobacterium bovis]|uniref:FAD:protein FMN transferase n=1 Tax=Lachnobacterium bovis TaxID=140626 RepID=A0A1H9QMB8_9FIRM|nr:FAD:protein FMN transferase [Lachnobacterium bovis]SER61560.1 thiamine biosynthesis lipoprotein [Lachnobacterium bovis]
MKHSKKVVSLTLITIFLLVITFTISKYIYEEKNLSTKPITKSNFSLDTIITITVYNTEDEKYINKCFEIINKYDNLFSVSKKNSDISKINNNPNQFVHVNSDTIELLKYSIKAAKDTNGLFDPTIGKLTDLWDISDKAKKTDATGNLDDKKNIPPSQKINSLLSHINYENIKIKNNSVKLSDSNSKIDLGGIAKGYIADKLKEYLNTTSLHERAIINLGGNILTINKKKSSEFNIGIQKPFSPNTTIGSLRVSNKSVVTSGIYERFFKCDNKIYHHILSTSNGYPVENNLEGVTIITKKSTTADALSTSVFTMGLHDGKKYIENLKNVEAIFITKDKKIYLTKGVKNFKLTDNTYTLS